MANPNLSEQFDHLRTAKEVGITDGGKYPTVRSPNVSYTDRTGAVRRLRKATQDFVPGWSRALDVN